MLVGLFSALSQKYPKTVRPIAIISRKSICGPHTFTFPIEDFSDKSNIDNYLIQTFKVPVMFSTDFVKPLNLPFKATIRSNKLKNKSTFST